MPAIPVFKVKYGKVLNNFKLKFKNSFSIFNAHPWVRNCKINLYKVTLVPSAKSGVPKRQVRQICYKGPTSPPPLVPLRAFRCFLFPLQFSRLKFLSLNPKPTLANSLLCLYPKDTKPLNHYIPYLTVVFLQVLQSLPTIPPLGDGMPPMTWQR